MEINIQPVLDNFVVLEGLDNAVTTSQLRYLSDKLDGEKRSYFSTFEPTEYSTGKMLRSVLKREHLVEAGTMAYLFAADRYEHLHHPHSGILAQLKRGKLVICDRYLFSCLAYQSLTWEFEAVFRLNRGFPLPAHLIFLDIPVPADAGRFPPEEQDPGALPETDSFGHQVREGYRRVLELYADSGMQIYRIDGTRVAEKVFGEIWKIIADLPIINL